MRQSMRERASVYSFSATELHMVRGWRARRHSLHCSADMASVLAGYKDACVWLRQEHG